MTTVMSHMQPMGTSTPIPGGRFPSTFGGSQYRPDTQTARPPVSFADGPPRYYQVPPPMGTAATGFGPGPQGIAPDHSVDTLHPLEQYDHAVHSMIQNGGFQNQLTRTIAGNHLKNSIAWARDGGNRPSTADHQRTAFIDAVDRITEDMSVAREHGAMNDTDFNALERRMAAPFGRAQAEAMTEAARSLEVESSLEAAEARLRAASQAAGAGPLSEAQLRHYRTLFEQQRDAQKTMWPGYPGRPIQARTQGLETLFNAAQVSEMIEDALSEFSAYQETQRSKPTTVIIVMSGDSLAKSILAARSFEGPGTSIGNPSYVGQQPSASRSVFPGGLVSQLLSTPGVSEALAVAAGQGGGPPQSLGSNYGGYQFRPQGRILGAVPVTDPSEQEETSRNTLLNKLKPGNWFEGRSTSGAE